VNSHIQPPPEAYAETETVRENDEYMVCSFTTDASTTVEGVPFNLKNEKYHILLAAGNIGEFDIKK
jgi:hypothetical protein